MAPRLPKKSATVISRPVPPVPDADECTPLLGDTDPLMQDAERGEDTHNGSMKQRSPFEIMSTLSILFIGVFVANVDMTFMLAAYPVISSELHAFQYGSWLVTSFMLAMCATQPLYGKLSNIFGRKLLLIVTCLLYALGAVVCALSTTMVQVIIGRVIGGTGGAGLICLVSIIITDLVPLREVAAYRSYVNVVQVIGRSVGAPVGGFVVEKLGWRALFAIVAPLAVGAAVLVACRLHIVSAKDDDKERPSTWSLIKKVDFLGSLLLSLTIVSLLLIFSLAGNELEWSDPRTFALVGTTVAFGVLFYVVEMYWVADPIFPPSLLGIRAVFTSYGLLFFANTAQTATTMSVPLFFQILLSLGPSKSGLFFLPSVVGNAVGGIVTGMYIKRTGRYIIPCYLSMILILVANILMYLRWGTQSSFKPILEDFYVFGAGMGTGVSHAAAFIVLTAGVTAYGISRDETDSEIHDNIAITGSGLYLSGNLGATVGASVSSAILQTVLKKTLAANLQGDELQDVMSKALESIEWVQHLEKGSRLRNIVVGSYVAGIKGTFLQAAVCAKIGLLLCLLVKNYDLK